MKLSYLDLTTTDPAFNLAVEEYVFAHLPKDRMYLMLWQNNNAIIIGKHQNALAQINEAFVRQHGIQVVRRLSGGGAVYHDMGNLNFTIITDAENTRELNFRLLCQPVIRALERVGIQAEVNGRNDMTIGGKKFSGNAQYVRNGRIMHHGTILFDSDGAVLAQALQVDEEKIRSKGVRSVRSRVTNVRPHLSKDMTLPEFRNILLESILEENPGDAYTLTDRDLAVVGKLKQRYDSWEWNYGHSPECTLLRKKRIEGCGTVEAYLTVSQSVIRNAAFRGDFFSTADPEELAHLLTGCRLEREAIREALEGTDLQKYFMGISASDLLDLLSQ